MRRLLLILLPCFAVLAACGAMPQKTYLDRAAAAIADKNWEMAYRFLEDGFVTENSANRERALALVKQHPAVLAGGAATFSIPNLVRSIDSNGLVAGPRHEMNRVTMYRVVAAPMAVAEAEKNILEALDQVKRSREFANRAKDEERAATAKEREEITAKWVAAAQNAKIACRDALECSKVFALTQIYIVENSQMKIQSANDTIIETFTPTETYAVGARATKIPRAGSTALVSLDLFCGKAKAEHDIYSCRRRTTSVYQGYAPFIDRMLIN
jgi:hypothetical protein